MQLLHISEGLDLPWTVSGFTHTNTHCMPAPGLSFSPAQSASAEHVALSRQLLADHLDVPVMALRFMRQVHGAGVVRIDTSAEEPDTPLEADAMITDRVGIVLCATIADCCAVLVADPVRRAVAAIHSGWRGTQQNIVGATIRAMTDAFGSRPGDLWVACSPCAGPDRYDVGPDVAVHFPAYLRHTERGTVTFDNAAAIRDQLLNAGLAPQAIRTDGTCTITDHRFHSHRRDGATAGRGVGFVGIR